MTRPTFTRQEETALRVVWRSAGEAQCPRCGEPMEATPIVPREDVSYVRRRSWLTCPRCGRTVVADDPRERL